MVDWTKKEHQERQKLEKKLGRVGTGYWKLTYHAKKIGKIGLVLYALNAGVQTMSLMNSDAYKSRERLAKNGYEIAQTLKEDETFKASVGGYIHGKAQTDPVFNQRVQAFQEDLEAAHNTQDEFMNRLEKIYNPLAYLN